MEGAMSETSDKVPDSNRLRAWLLARIMMQIGCIVIANELHRLGVGDEG